MATNRFSMPTVASEPSFLDRILRRRAPSAPRHETLPESQPRIGSLPVTETIERFVEIAATVPEIVSILARSQGERVHFVIQSRGIWHETIDELEPKLTALAVESGAAFDYSILRPGLEADPPGYLDVFLRG